MTAFPLENPHIRRHRIDGLEHMPIRRDAAGTIDMAYYLARGRRARSRAFYGWLARIRNALTRRHAHRVGARTEYAPCS